MRLVNLLSLLLATILVMVSMNVSAQIPIDDATPVRILEVLDVQGLRLGTVIVVGSADCGYEVGYEYWRFSNSALLRITDQESLEFAVLAEGEWDDPWVVEALGWQPEDSPVEWSHQAEVEWTPQDESHPPVVADGTYFGNPTLGGLTIQYSSRGPSSLTWFKLTEGAFMQLEDGAVFHRDSDTPTTGSWWHGSIEPGRSLASHLQESVDHRAVAKDFFGTCRHGEPKEPLTMRSSQTHDQRDGLVGQGV